MSFAHLIKKCEGEPKQKENTKMTRKRIKTRCQKTGNISKKATKVAHSLLIMIWVTYSWVQKGYTDDVITNHEVACMCAWTLDILYMISYVFSRRSISLSCWLYVRHVHSYINDLAKVTTKSLCPRKVYAFQTLLMKSDCSFTI